MPAHIHPSRLWFTCGTRPIFNDTAYPGSESGAGQGPPGAQSPFAPSGCYPFGDDVTITYGGVTPIIAHTGSCARPEPSRRFRLSLIRRVLAGCRQSPLGVGPSQHYLCNPCVGAWTPTPQCPSSALARFFPEGNGLTSNVTGSAHGKYSLQCNFNRVLLFGAAVRQAHRPEVSGRAVIPLCSGSHDR